MDKISLAQDGDKLRTLVNQNSGPIKCAEFLVAFAKLRKATISFVMSAPLSVCPYGTTRLPLDGFS